MIHVVLLQDKNFISFNNCTFKHNYAEDSSVVSLEIKVVSDITCNQAFKQNLVTPSNIQFRENKFIRNYGKLLSLVNTEKNKRTLYITGPTSIIQNEALAHHHSDLISVQNMVAYIYGPLNISHNSARAYSIWKLVLSEIIFYGMILFRYNVCYQVISLNVPYIKVMEYANITFIKNMCNNKLIEVEISDSWYNYCPFQYMTSSNKSIVTPSNYAINIIGISTTQQEECSFLYHDLNPRCEWLPSAVFSQNDSEIINHQIIQIYQQHLNYHRICLCYNNGSYNCSKNMFGPIYPGQALQISLCTPCDDNTFNLYAETRDSLQTNTSCKISNRAEILNNINNNATLINYTIASGVHEMCKLFLTMYSHKKLYAYEVFYVKLLSCPVGFKLKNGVCDCDPILTNYIDKCYIDYSAIRRPADTWMTAHTQTSNTNYLISDCPIDYCLPHSFNTNLLNPDQQC